MSQLDSSQKPDGEGTVRPLSENRQLRPVGVEPSSADVVPSPFTVPGAEHLVRVGAGVIVAPTRHEGVQAATATSCQLLGPLLRTKVVAISDAD